MAKQNTVWKSNLAQGLVQSYDIILWNTEELEVSK